MTIRSLRWFAGLALLLGLPWAGILLADLPVARYLEFPPHTLYITHAPFSWPVFVGLAVVEAGAILLAVRGKPIALYLADYSAVVTAWLLAVALPPLAPWWLTTIGVLSAIVVAKHLYGGLG